VARTPHDSRGFSSVPDSSVQDYSRRCTIEHVTRLDAEREFDEQRPPLLCLRDLAKRSKAHGFRIPLVKMAPAAVRRPAG
jgi:hypothetical protein